MLRPHRRAFDHVLIIMFENQYRSYVMQNPYMRRLAAQGIDMVNYYGVMHPSQTNYITSISGELCGITNDDPPKSLLTQNTIVDLIEGSPDNLTWNAYMDSYIPQNTPWTENLVPQDEFPYLIKHNPFSSFENIVRNQARWERIVDESQLWQDLLNGNFPNYAWFTPNMWNDGHYIDGTQKAPHERAPLLVDQLATWLESFFTAMRLPGRDSHLPNNTLVVVTFDEADFEADSEKGKKYYYDGPNQIYTVLLGDMIEPGIEAGLYNHYSLLKTIEQNFMLGDLGKNDEESNWFTFLWDRTFCWDSPSYTPIKTMGNMAVANYEGALYVVCTEENNTMIYFTYDGNDWSAPQEVGVSSEGNIALARCGNSLVLVYQTAECHLAAMTYDLQNGWKAASSPVADVPTQSISMVSFDQDSKLMLAYQTQNNDLYTTVYDGEWGAPVSLNYKTEGPLSLAVLGPSLYLICKVSGSDQLHVLTYNTADFNAVQVETSSYSGPYDDTTKDQWSLDAFPMVHFGSAPNSETPGEPEPASHPIKAGGALVSATMDGVIYLAHPGVSNPLMLNETFSLSGIMTAEKKVSYRASDQTTTSNGYGTFAQASWTEPNPIHGAFSHRATAMGRLNNTLILLFQPGPTKEVQMCKGGYEERSWLYD